MDALDTVTFPAAVRAVAKYGAESLDGRLTDEIDWDVLVYALYERGFLIPGPTVDHVSYWLVTDHWRHHEVAGLTLIQMLCGGWTHLAETRIFGGALGMPRLVNRSQSIGKTVSGTRVVPRGASSTDVPQRRLMVRFRYANEPAWKSATGRFRLLKGRPVHPWRPPPDHWRHEQWNIGEPGC